MIHMRAAMLPHYEKVSVPVPAEVSHVYMFSPATPASSHNPKACLLVGDSKLTRGVTVSLHCFLSQLSL